MSSSPASRSTAVRDEIRARVDASVISASRPRYVGTGRTFEPAIGVRVRRR